MRGDALRNVTKITMPQNGGGSDKLQWIDILKLIQDTFTYSGIQIQIITRREQDTTRINPPPNGENYAEHEVEKYKNE